VDQTSNEVVKITITYVWNKKIADGCFILHPYERCVLSVFNLLLLLNYHAT